LTECRKKNLTYCSCQKKIENILFFQNECHFQKKIQNAETEMADVVDFTEEVGLDDEVDVPFEEPDEGDEELDEQDDEFGALSDISIETDESYLSTTDEEKSDEEAYHVADMFGQVASAFSQYKKSFRSTKMACEPSIDRLTIAPVLKELMAADGFNIWPPDLQNDIGLIATRPNGELMACFWDQAAPNKIGIEQMRIINECIRTMDIKRALVVAQQPITSRAANSLHPNASVVLEKSLARNYTQHVLVPQQTVVVPPSVLDRLKITPDKLPKMSSKDPVAVWFGWKPGTVVKSRRMLGGMMEPHDYFREVC
jgi:DNA-directed RNA polymerase subunit H (RpoH/RPB5)/coenzyme F420-reducing hydrogenase delta subunit